ncbi:MAG TPA: hypothetical protein PLB30_08400 [Thermoleophilia bacterium]|nr:hypothetical protein [Thermoleophilia bacterium]HQG04338.1 hypothetical protein [Thermoleophilia bacterium]HQG54238.1 hypothetical protein [Thermoleophilia bacterium]HQJ98543.1 hypothetical protein [Thermoleophilia bacterium]
MTETSRMTGRPQGTNDMPKGLLFVRNLYAYDDLEFFLVSAIATILLVRAALAATGWPQLGGGTIHFAHLLWGGLGMLIALILFMAMQGRLWRQLATLAAGIGFGLFIDELGKFITADNDYFFEPTVAIIYVVFVVLLLLARAITRERTVSPQAALVNAFDLAKEAIIRDLDDSEREHALALLALCDQGDPVVRDLRTMLEHLPLSGSRTSVYQRMKHALERLYRSLTRRSWFKTIVVGWYVIVTLGALTSPFVSGGDVADLDFAERGELVSAFAAGVLVLIGVIGWRRSRLIAYRWFERSMLVTIFLYEFFAFYKDQLTAVFGLVIVLVTYATIRLMIREEEAAEAARVAAEAARVAAETAGSAAAETGGRAAG